MSIIPIWIEGGTRSGKTTALVGEFQRWVSRDQLKSSPLPRSILVFAANDDNKRELADRFALAVKGS